MVDTSQIAAQIAAGAQQEQETDPVAEYVKTLEPGEENRLGYMVNSKGNVNIVTSDGETGSVPEKQALEMFGKGLARPLNQDEIDKVIQQQDDQAEMDELAKKPGEAFVTSTLNSITGNLLYISADPALREYYKKLELANPTASVAGEIAGLVSPGGAASLAGKAVTKGVSKLMAKRIAGKIATAAEKATLAAGAGKTVPLHWGAGAAMKELALGQKAPGILGAARGLIPGQAFPTAAGRAALSSTELSGLMGSTEAMAAAISRVYPSWATSGLAEKVARVLVQKGSAEAVEAVLSGTGTKMLQSLVPQIIRGSTEGGMAGAIATLSDQALSGNYDVKQIAKNAALSSLFAGALTGTTSLALAPLARAAGRQIAKPWANRIGESQTSLGIAIKERALYNATYDKIKSAVANSKSPQAAKAFYDLVERLPRKTDDPFWTNLDIYIQARNTIGVTRSKEQFRAAERILNDFTDQQRKTFDAVLAANNTVDDVIGLTPRAKIESTINTIYGKFKYDDLVGSMYKNMVESVPGASLLGNKLLAPLIFGGAGYAITEDPKWTIIAALSPGLLARGVGGAAAYGAWASAMPKAAKLFNTMRDATGIATISGGIDYLSQKDYNSIKAQMRLLDVEEMMMIKEQALIEQGADPITAKRIVGRDRVMMDMLAQRLGKGDRLGASIVFGSMQNLGQTLKRLETGDFNKIDREIMVKAYPEIFEEIRNMAIKVLEDSGEKINKKTKDMLELIVGGQAGARTMAIQQMAFSGQPSQQQIGSKRPLKYKPEQTPSDRISTNIGGK